MTVTEAPRIVTSRLGFEDSYTLERYLATGGYEGLKKALSMTPQEVAAEVDTASLLGRGGAGFPAGRKWSMLRKAPTTYLVINGDESEPATFKDHLLIERDPHQIIEGVVIAAYAIGAAQAFIYIRGEFALGLERMQQALNEAYGHGAVGRRILGSEFSIDVVLHPGAGAYICGEETALLESLEGKRGFPRIKPPYFPAAIGLYGEPTVVNNVETMSNLPWIVINGGAAFAALGAGRSTGTRLFALAGHVEQPRGLRARDGEDDLQGPHLRPGPRRGDPVGARPSRPSSPAGSRHRGSVPTSSTCPWARTRSATPGRCSDRDRSLRWTTRPAWSVQRGGSPASSTASPAGSARRAGRVRAGSRTSWRDSNRAQGAIRTSTCSWTSATISPPG